MSCKFGKAPAIFGGELIDDVAGAQLRRQYLPGVGLEFKMPAPAGIGGVESEQIGKVAARIPESLFGAGVQWHMEMNAPFFPGFAGRGFIPGKSVGQILETPHDRASRSDEHLVEIDPFLELPEPSDRMARAANARESSRDACTPGRSTSNMQASGTPSGTTFGE